MYVYMVGWTNGCKHAHSVHILNKSVNPMLTKVLKMIWCYYKINMVEKCFIQGKSSTIYRSCYVFFMQFNVCVYLEQAVIAHACHGHTQVISWVVCLGQ